MPESEAELREKVVLGMGLYVKEKEEEEKEGKGKEKDGDDVDDGEKGEGESSAEKEQEAGTYQKEGKENSGGEKKSAGNVDSSSAASDKNPLDNKDSHLKITPDGLPPRILPGNAPGGRYRSKEEEEVKKRDADTGVAPDVEKEGKEKREEEEKEKEDMKEVKHIPGERLTTRNPVDGKDSLLRVTQDDMPAQNHPALPQGDSKESEKGKEGESKEEDDTSYGGKQKEAASGEEAVSEATRAGASTVIDEGHVSAKLDEAAHARGFEPSPTSTPPAAPRAHPPTTSSAKSGARLDKVKGVLSTHIKNNKLGVQQRKLLPRSLRARSPDGADTLQKDIIWSKEREGYERLSDNIILHIHGGGFIAQTSKAHLSYLLQYAEQLKCPVISVDYSLAPEAPFPIGMRQCYYVYCWVLENKHLLGWNGKKIGSRETRRLTNTATYPLYSLLY